ncbi:MAG: NUDIX domain-containing protein [Streptococcaceae bacterium]|jgi:8-oxo-dGTP diphosphatase|nr:NUDIX domain-containing protein [Streptococcaceae bacterium]
MVEIYGKKREGVEYSTRVGVHVIIPNAEKKEICLIKAPNGAYFLPGGEIEAGETHSEAIARELIEETGFKAEIGAFYGQADEYYYSRNRDTYYYNPAFIYECLSFEKIGERTEKKSVPEWFEVEKALEKLKRGSHKWGLQQWINSQG